MNRRGFLKGLGAGAGAAGAALMLPAAPIIGQNELGEESVMVPLVLTRKEVQEAHKNGGLPQLLACRARGWKVKWELADECSKAGWFEFENGKLTMK
jgi:hypothetical protein